MAETIRSLIDSEIDRFGPIDRQRFVDSGVHQTIVFALGTPKNRGAITLPGEGTLSTLDLNRKVADERIEDVRTIVKEIINRMADRANLG